MVWQLSLSVQFWDLYAICNQMGGGLADIWDGQQVKLTFRRTFDDNMLEKWFELEEIVKSVVYKPGGDALVWVCNIVMEFTLLVLFMQL